MCDVTKNDYRLPPKFPGVNCVGHIVMERLKSNSYLERTTQTYFWRTYDGQEIDLVEEKNGVLHGYEVKWSEKKKIKIPKSWKESYPEALLSLINRDNYLPFVLKGKK